MAKTMRAMVLHEWDGPLSSVEMPIPEPGEGEVLLRVRACGVGYTLNNIRSGRLRGVPNAALPRIIGHEVAAHVTRLGHGVTGVETGDRVAVYFYLTCGECEVCRWGHDPLCPRLRGLVGVSSDGGLAEYMVVPSDNVIPIPDEVSDVDAAVASDAVVTPWHALTSVVRLGPLESLTVIGAGGGVGIHAVMIGRMLGAQVIGVDVTDEKLSFAGKCGADDVVDGRRNDIVDRVMNATAGRGSDVVLDYVATSATLRSAFDYLAPNGTLIVQGVNPPGTEFSVEPRQFIGRQVSVSGSRYGSRKEVRDVLQLIASGRLKPAVSTTTSLDSVEDLFDRLEDVDVLGRAAVTFEAMAP